MGGVIKWMADNDKLSGWAQAIGAILALVVAIGIPALQSWIARREERMRIASSIRAAAAVVSMAAHAAQTVIELAKRAEEELVPLRISQENFQDLCHMVEGIKVHAMPTAGCVHAIISARQSVRRLQEAIEAANREIAMTVMVVSENTLARISDTRQNILEAAEELETEASYIARGRIRKPSD